MLSSTGGGDISYNDYSINKTDIFNGVSSLSPSPSPFSPSNLFHETTRTPKTMEEVWKDIASLHDHPSVGQDLSATPTLHNKPRQNPNFMLQDFLGRPFNKDSPARIISCTQVDSNAYGSSVPHPATVLSLNSGTGLGFLDSSGPLRPSSHLQGHRPISNVSLSNNNPFEAFDSSSGLAAFGKKRIQESDNSSGYRRHKRMIKNRESAARSRARKQENTSPSTHFRNAYTNELELEVAHLLEENARLRRQQEELFVGATVQLPKKHTLHRTSTAPF
ncbi:hypothetical protein K2173_006218 [Erythroxylum novogranatense]|uniref:BZIP domain-containing protein n=1 Tax=Erythroxylum novogranatense TaxID=1862640 RepID=A0AAV8TEF3_9ROSI|nr:hypothetical protein K2173_006218 [Erythroxylum novogranatense]